MTNTLSSPSALRRIDLPLLLIVAGLVIQYTFIEDKFWLPLIEPLMALALCAWLFQSPDGFQRMSRTLRNPLVLIWLAVTILATAQWAIARNWEYAADEVRQLWLITLLLASLLSRTAFDGRTAIQYLLVAVAVSAVIAVMMLWTGWAEPPFARVVQKDIFAPVTGEGTRLAVGLFSNPNEFAAFLYWPALIVLSALTPRINTRNIGRAALALFLGASLFWSLARAVLAGTIAAALLYFLLRRRLPNRKLLAFLLLWFVAIIIGFAFLSLGDPVEGFFYTIQLRGIIWKSVLEAAVREPCFLGFGVGVCNTSFVGDHMGFASEDPHNLVLYMLIHFGAIGAISLVAIFLLLVYRGWREYSSGRMNGNPLLTAVWSGWIALPAIAMLYSLFVTPQWRTLFFFLAAAFWQMCDANEQAAPSIDASPGPGSTAN